MNEIERHVDGILDRAFQSQPAGFWKNNWSKGIEHFSDKIYTAVNAIHKNLKENDKNLLILVGHDNEEFERLSEALAKRHKDHDLSKRVLMYYLFQDAMEG